jgi:hypothetical protein
MQEWKMSFSTFSYRAIVFMQYRRWFLSMVDARDRIEAVERRYASSRTWFTCAVIGSAC